MLRKIINSAMLLALFVVVDFAAAQTNTVEQSATVLDSNIDLFLDNNSQYLISTPARRKLELQHLNAATCICAVATGEECKALQHPKVVSSALRKMFADRGDIPSRGYLHYLGGEVDIDFSDCGYSTENANTGLALLDANQVNRRNEQKALISVGHQNLELENETYRLKFIGRSIKYSKVTDNDILDINIDDLICPAEHRTRRRQTSSLDALLLSDLDKLTHVENPEYSVPESIRRMYFETDDVPEPARRNFKGSRFFEASIISIEPAHSDSCDAGCVRKIIESTVASLSFWKRRCATCRAQGTEAIAVGDAIFINEELAHLLHSLERQGGHLTAVQREALRSSEKYVRESNRRAIARGMWRSGQMLGRNRYIGLGRNIGFTPGLDQLSNSRFVEFSREQLADLDYCLNPESLAALPYRSLKHLCDPALTCREETHCLSISLMTGARACPADAIACGREADSYVGFNTEEFAFLDRQSRPINEPLPEYTDQQIALNQVAAHEVGHWFGLSHISRRDAASFVPPGWLNIMTGDMDGESNVCTSRVNGLLANEAMNALWPYRLNKDKLHLLKWKE